MTVQEKVMIRPLNLKVFNVGIEQLNPLVEHRFAEKARKEMIGKQMGTLPAKKKDKRDPKAEFEASLHIIQSGKFTYKSNDELGLGEVEFTGKIGFPAYGIKAAIVAAARNVDDLPMTLLRGAMFIRGDENDLVEIEYQKLFMREDIVTIGRGITDLRYRPDIRGWKAKLQIEYNADVLSADQIVNLLEIAGFSVGLGEMRPGKTGGTYGRFKVIKKTIK